MYRTLIVAAVTLLTTPTSARSPTAHEVGLQDLPTPPTDKRLVLTGPEWKARLQEGAPRPVFLVPFRVRKDGSPMSYTRFYDEKGWVYRKKQAAFYLTEACPEAMAAYNAGRASPTSPFASGSTTRPGAGEVPRAAAPRGAGTTTSEVLERGAGSPAPSSSDARVQYSIKESVRCYNGRR